MSTQFSPVMCCYVSFLSIVGAAWPGGMRGAIESAACLVEQSWRVKSKTKVKFLKSNLQISDPPHISSQRPRAFRPADPKPPSS